MTGEAEFNCAVETAKINILKYGAPNVMETIAGIICLAHDPEHFIEFTRSHPDAFDSLRLGIAHKIDTRRQLSEREADWLADYLKEKITRPSAGRGPLRRLRHQALIGINVAHVSYQHGLKPTRNDASPPHSACDAVAEAMKNLGLKPSSYKRIKEHWLAAAPIMREADIFPPFSDTTS
jgi:hypothetical protein